MSEQAPAEKPAFTIPVQNGPRCPECGSTRLNKDGMRYLKDGSSVQRYLCKDCGYRFSWPRSGKQPKRQNLKSGHALALDECSSRALALLEQSVEGAMSVEEKNGSGPAGATTPNQPSQTRTADIKGKVVEYLWWMEKQGFAESTIRLARVALKVLMERGANLLNPESVKEVIAKQKWSQSRRRNVINAYDRFAKYVGLSWEKPKCNVQRKIPFIPTEQEIDALIAGSPKKLAAFLQLLKETAMRSGEAKKLKWSDIDFEGRCIRLNDPEKNSLPRIWKVSSKLFGMLNSLPRNSVRVFGDGPINSLKTTFLKVRKRLAYKLQNPRLLQISFHTLRHWKATMLYHQTKDILYVKRFLGHKEVRNTEIYITIEETMFQQSSDEFTVRVASTPEEIKSLLEAGFDYVCEKDGLLYFRKRK
jgi:integrase/DNA-directed RNA polymerase subunit RPC12/RpoP